MHFLFCISQVNNLNVNIRVEYLLHLFSTQNRFSIVPIDLIILIDAIIQRACDRLAAGLLHFHIIKEYLVQKQEREKKTSID